METATAISIQPWIKTWVAGLDLSPPDKLGLAGLPGGSAPEPGGDLVAPPSQLNN